MYLAQRKKEGMTLVHIIYSSSAFIIESCLLSPGNLNACTAMDISNLQKAVALANPKRKGRPLMRRRSRNDLPRNAVL